MKKLKDLSWDVSEEQYREYPALSYSVIARYEKGGFSAIKHLHDEVKSDSITFGSMVDCLITEGQEVFNKKFAIANFKIPTDSIKAVIDILLAKELPEDSLVNVSSEIILDACNQAQYQFRWSDTTRISKVVELGTEYYDSMKNVGNRQLVSNDMYQEVLSTVAELNNNPLSKAYLQHDNNDVIDFLYQTKFKTNIDGLDVQFMFDLLVVNYDKKAIIPIDLKTTSTPEYEFAKRYLEHRYDIQSRLYWIGLRNILDNDEYFRDFKLFDFKFLVINKDNKTPLMYTDELCSQRGNITLTFKSGRKTILRDPFTIGLELQHYIKENSKVPDDILLNRPNDLLKQIYKL